MIILILSSSKLSLSSEVQNLDSENQQFFAPLYDKLLIAGVSQSFIDRCLANPQLTFDDRYVRINVTNFANNVNYSSNWNKTSVNKTVEFIRANEAILNLAKLEYDVPGEVIASILFIETKHGTYLGNNSVLSVYFSTAMCSQPEYIAKNKEFLRSNFVGTDDELEELNLKIDNKSRTKSDWAIEQIKALEIMEGISPVSVFNLKGSWAGAFGISQFLPSSYLNWAVDGDKDGIINLFNTNDAIFSVANYLKTNGWSENYEERVKAIFHYNNSSAYVEAVLKLAEYANVGLQSTYLEQDQK